MKVHKKRNKNERKSFPNKDDEESFERLETNIDL